MEQAESNPDSLRVFTTEKWFVQLGMAARGIACCSKCGTSGRILLPGDGQAVVRQISTDKRASSDGSIAGEKPTSRYKSYCPARRLKPVPLALPKATFART